jgi:hypothetical protein
MRKHAQKGTAPCPYPTRGRTAPRGFGSHRWNFWRSWQRSYPCHVPHLVRYGGCLAPYSHLRGAIIPAPCQQGVEEQEDRTASPRWSWTRLLKRVFALYMARCPWCQRGALRIIAAITQGEVIWKILRHLKLAADPPPIAPARVRQEAFAWSSA